MRLFVAVRPPTDVIDALDALPRAEPSTARWTTRDQWHVTVRFLGNVDDPTDISSALERVADTAAPVDVRIGPRAAILGHQIVYLPVTGLDDVAHAVEMATKELGDPPQARRFRGHLTLARTKGSIVDTAALRCEHTWRVGEIELVRSQLGGGPARYDTLARFALRG